MSSEDGKRGSKVDSSVENSQVNNEENPLKQLWPGCQDSINVGESPNKSKSTGDGCLSPQNVSDMSLEASIGHLNPENVIRENTFNKLIQKMRSEHYNISEDQELLIWCKCKLLFEKDYICKVVNNYNYCMNYPIGIIVPVGKKADIEGSFVNFDGNQYSSLVEHAHEFRRRSRFVAPAILFDNKFICRSGTLSVKPSTLHEMTAKTTSFQTPGSVFELLKDRNFAFSLFHGDKDILETLKIEYICDLLFKTPKFCNKTNCFVSTELEHQEVYTRIKKEEMPYPGSDFFDSYHNGGRNGKDLFFDWTRTDVQRELHLTDDLKALFPEINVEDYKNWDLIQLSQNYLKIMISCLLIGTGGIVVHCSSGWDRAPLFVSLLRLSLWADGAVHENLEYHDIAYLTLAYDWFLFGHKLPYRFQVHEEIMHFCFNFLEHITSDEFSVTRLFEELPEEKKRGRTLPKFIPGRRIVLNKVRALVLELYNEEIIKKNEEL